MDNIKFKKRILFIGIPDMAYIGLDTFYYAGVNIVGVIGPPKTHHTYNAFKNFVLSHKLNFIEYDNLNSEKLLNTLKKLNIDLGVTCSFNHKIPVSFMNTIKDGILNLHPSLLPKYRGGNPYSRVIMNGEIETGITIHFMSEKFDEGDIVYQEKCQLDEYETMGTIFDKTNKLGCKMYLKTLIEYEKSGILPRTKQPEGDYIKAYNLNDRETLIDFNKSAIEVERFVRALNPYINAATIYKKQIMKIFKVRCSDDVAPLNFTNGQIYKITDCEVYIKTSHGSIIPEIMQYSGYFLGDTKDFIRIAKPQIGDMFNNG